MSDSTCGIEGCGRRVRSHGRCRAHPVGLVAECSIEGCGRPVSARSWCGTHYKRWRKHGDPLIVTRDAIHGLSPVERFWLRVDKDGPIPPYAPDLGPCWVWTGLTRYGYGTFSIARRFTGAHIYAYELLVGPVPDGLELDHLCHTLSNGSCVGGDACPHRRCVNPAHLEAVTGAENARRRMLAMTRCGKGHLYDETNTRWSDGHRHCRECEREGNRARRGSPPTPGTRHVKIMVMLGEADAAVINYARQDQPLAVWVREASLAAATRGMTTLTGRTMTGTIGNQAKALVSATEAEAVLIDAARGGTPRSTWMRAAALAAARELEGRLF